MPSEGAWGVPQAGQGELPAPVAPEAPAPDAEAPGAMAAPRVPERSEGAEEAAPRRVPQSEQ